MKVPPHIPEDTCPYIDMVQDIVDKMVSVDDIDWRRKQADLAEVLLEYIRSSNYNLRDSSKYWYNKSKKVK